MYNGKKQIKVCLGLGKEKGRIAKGQEESIGDDRYVHYFECSNGFMDINVHQNLSNYTLRIFSVSCMPTTSIKWLAFKKTKQIIKQKKQHSAVLSPPCPLTPRHCVRSSFLDFPIALHAGPTAIFITVYSFHLTIKLSHMKMPINILAFLTYNMVTLHGSSKMLACQPSLAMNPETPEASGPMMCAE